MAASKKMSDELNFETWAPSTRTKLIQKGLWDVVENGVPPDPSKNPKLSATIQPEELSKWRDLVVKDTKALQVLQSSLPNSAFRKTLSASSAKDAWDLLKNGNKAVELVRLEKQFEELSMNEGETIESYVGRVTVILEEMRRLNRVKSKYEVNKKVLSSLKMPYTIVAPCLEENAEVMENMPLESLPEFFDICDDVAEEACVLMMKGMSLDSRPGKWCGVCKKRNHNEEDCYYNPRKGSSTCKRKNQQQVVKESLEEVEVEYLMLAEEALGNGTYDEDVWMIYPDGTTNHMTPYEKYFTALDRTHKAKVGLADGKFLRVEGRGDVKIVMKDGKKKTIKNVLFVLGLNRNVLSLDQMIARGYSAFTPPGKCTFLDRTGAVFGETVRDERGPALRLNVIEGNLTS
ncbi:unnamed protein product [Brassica rapa subsp. trilocularis]